MSLPKINDRFRYTDRGAMHDQITIMQPNPTSALDGSPGAPTVFASNLWAYIRALRSQEVNINEFVQSEAFYDVRTPYIPGVNSSMSVVAPSGAVWFIVSVVDPDSRQMELRMLCREINSGGESVS